MVKIEMLMRGVRGKTQDKGRQSLATKGITIQGVAGDTDRPPPLSSAPIHTIRILLYSWG